MIKYNIKNRWTGDIQFEAEIDCSDGAPLSLKIGLAVRWAAEKDANLRNANLCGADLCGANLCGADLCGANLRNANLCGVNLCGADLCGADLRNADLRNASLCGADLRNANLRSANLCGADLRNANLCGADLRNASLCGADLRNANLCGADLRNASLRNTNLRNAPDCIKIKDIHKSVYEVIEKEGNSLETRSWRTCETTHCRAEWVVHLAGDAGRVLEWQLGTPAAAALIYQLSDPTLNKIPDFYCDNETTMLDIKKLAGVK